MLMSIIKDGTVSGHVPSDEVFVVHYPGYPSSISRAIETVGGTDSIVKARSSKTNKLELRFRPHDPYSHPAFGQLCPCNNLLLRISRKYCRSSQNDLEETHPMGNSSSVSQIVETATAEDFPCTLSADIVARVHEAYVFNGMTDYQHVLPVHAEAARRKGKTWAEINGPSSVNGGLAETDEDNLMILVPPLFSPKDIPENLVLRPSITASSKKKMEGVVQHRWEMDIEPCLAIDFDIKEIPKAVNWERHVPQGSDLWKKQISVSKLFDERPIWPKASICERLGDAGLNFGESLLKRLLFRTAYYFGSGPFHRFWIRKGYDPRKDPESRIYQRIDFRVPKELRGYCDKTSGLKHRWQDICAFKVFPNKCQTYLQLCEVCDDYIKEEIQKPVKQTACAFETGWFSSVVLSSLRSCVKLRFLSVYPLPGAESFLKSVSETFEKLKRMRFHVNILKAGEEGGSQVSEELMVDEDKAEVNEEENEMEDDEVEEELDAYDFTDMAVEDADFSLQPDSYMDMDNVSKNYLQELFGSFPSNVAGHDGGLHIAESDEEYQIYEPDSDGNNSEDDY